MSGSKLIHLSYFDPRAEVRLSAYADTIIVDHAPSGGDTITAIRFGGYPEAAQAMSDAIYGGGTIEASWNDQTQQLKSIAKGYRRQQARDGNYAIATLMANDDVQEAAMLDAAAENTDDPQPPQPRKCYIFCPVGDRDKLFEELDQKTAAPLIPEFRDYVIECLIARGDLRPLQVFSLRERLEAWVLELKPNDENIIEILEDGLRAGKIEIPGAVPGAPDGFSGVETVTNYLNTFGATVADRIRNQFTPLFDPASEPLSDEVLAINRYIQEKAGYSLYDAQLAVAEATKRQLQRKGTALIVAECGSGKTKIGATALGALLGTQTALTKKGLSKSFGVVICPSHMTRKWVREIGETLPNTNAVVVKDIGELRKLYSYYEQGDRTVYAVFSKERARDGYMRYPAVTWNKRKRAFLCPDCMEPVEMEFSDDGTKYLINADQFFFQNEHRKNHKCPNCGSALWAPVLPDRKTEWVKIGGYGWIHRALASQHISKTKNSSVLGQLYKIIQEPDGIYPVKGAQRRFPLSTYIKRKMHGKIDALLADELHEYNNASGQGDAMAELYGASKLFVGMTATLINGYSSGIFHLLYRLVPGLMRKDGKLYSKPSDFDNEYGVVENVYEIEDADYNANRRATKRKLRSKRLPGVSPLVYSRFLLEYCSFLSLTDMGKNLPDYEEIPIALEMPEQVKKEYKLVEEQLRTILKSDHKAAQKIMSSYLNLLTVYPDQPYDQPAIVNPIDGHTIAKPRNEGCFDDTLPKEEKVLEIVKAKVAAGERVLVYTSWTRTDSQQKLAQLFRREGFRTEILTPKISPDKREAWVEARVKAGLQVLITNPKCVETGLDLNTFTTLIFYSMGYNLFTLRQASRRSWRINQLAPRVEVYMLYYADTMQAKAMKLMASKLAVAGIIEGSFSDEGLAAMSDVRDMTSQMAKELSLGIKDNVEDIAAAFKKMAIINPDRHQPSAGMLPEAASEPVSGPAAAEEKRERRQPCYEELLAMTTEDTKKKSKKEAVLENQLSIFDFAA